MTQTRQLFSEKDRNLIESSSYDPLLEPRFNALSCYLTWDDEAPSGITPEAYDTLSNLWTARAFLYHGFELDEIFDDNHFRNVWNQAIEEKLRWTGFNRLSLSENDKDYYKQMLSVEDPFD